MSARETAPDRNARPLPMRVRSDLIFQAVEFSGRRYWHVKDPISLRYYQLRNEEYFLLQLLDGQTSVEEIVARFEQEFAPQRIRPQQLVAFLSMLHRQGLILADAPGQADELLGRRGQLRRRKVLDALTSVLAIRFRGFDPDRLLRWLYPKVRWLFSPWVFAACVLLFLSALVLLTVRFDSLVARLPEFRAFFSLQNLPLIGLSIVIAKVLHELGHALTCRRYGGECHEMGVMLLVFTPVLYCNVSDAWMMPNRRHRIWITAAGMCVELVLASICTFLWWFSEPGLLNTMCLNIMFVCSVSTVLFNGNPLLRYDGYYILSDLVEVPNLREQSFAVVRRSLCRWFLGVEAVNERMLPDRRRGFLAAYWLVAGAYRFMVVIAILWFLHAMLKPSGLQVLALALAVPVLAGMLCVPLWRAAKFVAHVQRREQVKWLRFGLWCGMGAALLVAVFAVPLPRRVTAPVTVEPSGAERVYVSAPGTLSHSVAEGRQVQTGETLAKLQDLELDERIAELTWQAKSLDARLQGLHARRVGKESVGNLIPTTEEALRDVRQRLAQRLADLQRLTLTAPIDGTVLPAPTIVTRPLAGELEGRRVNQLDPESVGSHFDSGTLFCLVGDPGRLDAVALIDQSDIEFVEVGQRVHMVFDQLPGVTLWGRVEEISEIDVVEVPAPLAAKGHMPVIPDEHGAAAPASTSFQARMSLDAHDQQILLGATGRAKIHVASQSLGARFVRFLQSTFRFSL